MVVEVEMIEVKDISEFDPLLLKRQCLVSIPLEVATIEPKLEKGVACHIRIDSVKLFLRPSKLNPLEIFLIIGLELQIHKLPSSLPPHTLRYTTLLSLDHFLESDLRYILDIVHLLDPDPSSPHLVSYCGGCAGAEMIIEDNVSGLSGDLNNSF